MSREEEFLAQLPVIDRAIGWVCARRALRGADAEDFASEVRKRLIENDYEILARFEGRSSLKTYLVVVVNRLYLDFQVRRFGKWRSSATARRLGPLAVALERLIHRDGLTFEEACGVLQSDTSLPTTREALSDLLQRLPARPARGALASAAEPLATDADAAERRERQELAERTFGVIRRTLACLPPEDQLLMRLHFASDLTLAAIARARGLEQKGLYRRRDEILSRLKDALAADGIGARDAQELLQNLDWDAALGDAAADGEQWK